MATSDAHHDPEPGEVARTACPANYGPSLTRVVLEVRLRLGPDATPEAVAAAVRAGGCPNATLEDVRSLWDEGHLPPE